MMRLVFALKSIRSSLIAIAGIGVIGFWWTNLDGHHRPVVVQHGSECRLKPKGAQYLLLAPSQARL